VTCTQTVTLGAYLLGALEPPERYEFEAHIAGCDSCRTELVRLAPLPGMLNQISVEDFDEGLPPGELYPTAPMPIQTLAAPTPRLLAPPPELLDPPTAPQPPVTTDPPATAEPAGGRRRRMWQLAAAAAVVIAVVAAGMFGWRTVRHAEPPPTEPGITWTATAPETDVTADVRLIDHEWGTELQITMANVPPNRECYVIVYDHYGHRQIAGWWGTDHAADEEIPASTSIQRSKIEKLEFRLDDKVPFLTVHAPVG